MANPQWVYVKCVNETKTCRRFALLPAETWYGAKHDGNVLAMCSNDDIGWGIVTSLTERQLAATPAGALQQYMVSNANSQTAVPYFTTDGRAVFVNSAGAVLSASLDKDNVLHVTPLTSSPLPSPTASITSCVGTNATFFSSDADAVVTASSSKSQWLAFSRYGQFMSPETRPSKPRSSVQNGVVYAGRVTLLPKTMHAVWLTLPQPALLVVQYGRAILIAETVFGSFTTADDVTAFLADAFVRYVSYDAPDITSDAEFYKPIVPLPFHDDAEAANPYAAIILSGRGEAALLRVQGTFRISTLNMNDAFTKSARHRARLGHYFPGDVLLEYRTVQLFVVATVVPGTVVVRRLNRTTGIMDAARQLHTRDITQGVLNGKWSLLSPPIIDATVTSGNVLHVLAGNTQYKAKLGLMQEEGHVMTPCNAFSITHLPECIGGDETLLWVSMACEKLGVPVVLMSNADS